MRNLNSTGKQGSSLGLNDKSNPVPQLNAIRERGGEKKKQKHTTKQLQGSGFQNQPHPRALQTPEAGSWLRLHPSAGRFGSPRWCRGIHPAQYAPRWRRTSGPSTRPCRGEMWHTSPDLAQTTTRGRILFGTARATPGRCLG